LRGLEADRAASRRGPLTGALLSGRWRVGELLGCGGNSSVYAAIHRNGKELAIKVLRREFSGDPRSRARFLQEGSIVNRIGHPATVAVLDDGVTDDGELFLVMDRLWGVTLAEHQRARGGRLSENEVLLFADAVLDVLSAVHARGVVHRDIKPSNLFLTAEGTLKLLDFGAARL
jgi:serine/threonine protein kinase